MGGTMAAGFPPLMMVMAVVAVVAAVAAIWARSTADALVPMVDAIEAATEAACLARMMVNCMSLKAASSFSPSGSGEYPWGKVGSQPSLRLR